MSFIGNMLSNGNGAGFQAQGANGLNNATTQQQLNQLYSQSQGGLAMQQAFAQAAGAQNGLQNQSNTFNQLQGVANGTGPNPAQAMLAQQTGQNVAQTGALMAGQRGAGANVGLMARQAGQAGMNAQQQAVGQGATMQANQSLNALGQMSGIANQQVGQQMGAITGYSQGAQNEQGNLIGAQNNFNSAQAGMQANMNTTNAGIAAGNQKQQGQIIGGLIGGAGAGMMMAKGGMIPAYADGTDQGTVAPQPTQQAPVSTVSPHFSWVNALKGATGNSGGGAAAQANTPMSGMNSQEGLGKAGYGAGFAAGKGLKSLFGSSPQPSTATQAQGEKDDQQGADPTGGSEATPSADAAEESSTDMEAANALGPEGLAKGGMVPHYDDGGSVQQMLPLAMKIAPLLAAMGGGIYGDSNNPKLTESKKQPPKPEKGKAYYANGGRIPQHKVDAMVSPGERYLPPKAVKEVAAGKKAPLKAGEKIPGKPKVKGDSLVNDVVPKKLDVGGIVLPNSVMQSKDPAKEAAAFVAATLRKQSMKNGR